jgi:hypothetical protein
LTDIEELKQELAKVNQELQATGHTRKCKMCNKPRCANTQLCLTHLAERERKQDRTYRERSL